MMKSIFRSIYQISFFLFLFILSCSKSEESTYEVTTAPVTDITFSNAVSGGEVLNVNPVIVNAYGVCWSTNPEPDINDNKTIDGAGTGAFTSLVAPLEPNTKYYLRAYATFEGNLVQYGEEISFTTEDISVPCSPTQNSISMDNMEIIHGAQIDEHGWSNGDFVIKGSSLVSDFNIEFNQAPNTGVYKTSGADWTFSDDQCHVIFVRSIIFFGKANEDVYAKKYDDGSYSVSFCDLEFNSAQNVSFTSDGNLTTD